MALKTIAGAFKLRSDSANSYARMRAGGLPSGGLNSAYRSIASQRALFLARYTPQYFGRGRYGDARWYRGRRYVRTSGAGMVAIPGTSTHGNGLALDVSTRSSAHAWLVKHGERFGWKRTIRSEPWHFEYSGKLDADAVMPIQKAVHVTADGIWKTITDKATWAVRAASRFRGGKHPYGKRYTQARVGTKVDNAWGHNSGHKHDLAIKALQRALKRLGLYSGKIDGIYGPLSEAGFLQARKAFKR